MCFLFLWVLLPGLAWSALSLGRQVEDITEEMAHLDPQRLDPRRRQRLDTWWQWGATMPDPQVCACQGPAVTWCGDSYSDPERWLWLSLSLEEEIGPKSTPGYGFISKPGSLLGIRATLDTDPPLALQEWRWGAQDPTPLHLPEARSRVATHTDTANQTLHRWTWAWRKTLRPDYVENRSTVPVHQTQCRCWAATCGVTKRESQEVSSRRGWD